MVSVGDIGVLLELYKNDKQFRKFLVNVFLDKLYAGQAISSYELQKAVLNTIDLKEYRSEIIKYLLNTEHFYSTKVSFKLRLLSKILANGLFREEQDIIPHLIKTI